MKEFIIRSEQDTEKLGLMLAEELQPGDVLALVGDLGAGKTTLTKYIAKGLGITEMITSPTFTIMNEYLGGRMPLYHVDAYRLENEEAALDIGLDEYFYKDGLCVIEWADLIEGILPEETKCIFMEYGDNPEERVYRCTFLE